ncbi:unnamed protein product [Phytophthora fragariaefolia]|uniref:Unnamed protein product n=1 Tax=Phytophthora fragariaefolia TaxID=1490495 RepID=A0A9W6XYJ2_9STRA|nr:unnamed protein product [Phytophthora fragariaefolia]
MDGLCVPDTDDRYIGAFNSLFLSSEHVAQIHVNNDEVIDVVPPLGSSMSIDTHITQTGETSSEPATAFNTLRNYKQTPDGIGADSDEKAAIAKSIDLYTDAVKWSLKR